MSGAQTSTGPNVLYDPLMAGRVGLQQNALAQGQQTVDANEMEQASRAANWIISQDPENKDPDKQAQSYTAALRILRANNYALKSPDAYPGFEAMQYLARAGTPSKDLYQQTQDSAWANANRIIPAAAPPADGGGTSENNFGNIRPTGASSGFNTYATPQEGVAAMSHQLALYASGSPATGGKPITTLNGLTATWAPKGDGNNNPAAYAASLGKMLGLDPDAPINLGDPLLQSRLIPAMAQIEKGKPFSQPRDVLLAGIQAGLGGAPVTAAAAAPGAPGAAPPRPTQFAGPGAPPAPTATKAPPAAPPALATTTDPETQLPVLSAPQNALAPPPPEAPDPAIAEAQRTGRPVPVPGKPGIFATPQGTFTTAPGREATAAPPPAAAAAPAPPAATAPPPPPAAPQQPPFSRPTPVNPATHLTTAQEQELNGLLPMASRSREGQAQWVARKQHMIEQNQADQRQYESQVNTWQNQQGEAADRAERLRLSQEADKRAADKAKQDADEKNQPLQGNDIDVQHERLLNNLAPKIRNGTATEAEKALYSGSYYALQQKGGQPVTITDPSDPSRTIPATITRRLAPELPEPPGGALPLVMAQPGAGKQEQMNDAQATSANYADRMVTANRVMNKLDSDATTWGQKVRESAGNFIGYNINSPEYQRLRQAQENFLIGILRKESGAAVSQAEWDRYAKFYFPMPGDDASTLKQKQETREQAMRGLQREAGPAYKVLNGPRIGSMEDGYRFKGGDPADKTNWERVK